LNARSEATPLNRFAPTAPAPALAGQRGFTLVELMVVVAIIALLAAVVIPNYVHARAQAAVSQSESNLKEIATALELYYADNQTYPASGNVTPDLFGGAKNPYLSATPVNALGRQVYVYSFVAAAGGTPATYSIEDPGLYDPTTLSSVPLKGAGAGTSGLCTQCTKLYYDPQDGLYGQ
jgi:type II secretion system protein G